MTEGRTVAGVAVRQYRSGDRAAVIVLWREAFPGDLPRNDPALILARKVAEKDGLVWVAVDVDELVGAVMAGYDGFRGRIYHLAVDDAHRHRGIGVALVKVAEAELARRGCRKVNLQVRATNSAGISFYEALGYSVEQNIGMGKVLGA